MKWLFVFSERANACQGAVENRLSNLTRLPAGAAWRTDSHVHYRDGLRFSTRHNIA